MGTGIDPEGRLTAFDAERFEDVYETYHRQVRAYCARRVTSDVEDLVAEVFLVAWRKIEEIPDGNSALLWLYGVAFRVLKRRQRSHVRRRRAFDRVGSMIEVDSDTPIDVVVVQRDEYRLVRKAASRLRSIDQEILRLTLWEELSHAEVARILDISVDAVKQRSHRARRRLADEYRMLRSTKPNPPLLGEEVPQ